MTLQSKGISLAIVGCSAALLGATSPAVANEESVQTYVATCASIEEGSRFDSFEFKFEISSSRMLGHISAFDGSARPIPSLSNLWASFVPSSTPQKRFGVLDRSDAGNSMITVMAFPQDWTGRPNDFVLRLIAKDKTEEQTELWTENFRCEFPKAQGAEQDL